MTCAVLAFAAGVVLLQTQAALPALAWALALVPASVSALKYKRLIPIVAFGGGFFWAAYCAQERMSDWLAPQLEGRDIEVVGGGTGLPAPGERGVRFEFDLESATRGERVPSRVLLWWYRSAQQEADPALLAGAVHPGERWMFTVRLRRPHGNVNPNGFDYEGWLLERGIGATGYVRSRGEQRLLGGTPAAGILSALAVGDQRAIAAEEWRLFSRTGVTHLMSISGLHVTLVSGLVGWLVSALWRRIPWLALRLPARKAGAAAALVRAFGYTLLAGFAVPAQRTCYMVTVVAIALWTGGIASPVRVLALAAAVVLAADPWAPLSPGFWLSFSAVALIFYVAAGWTGREPRVAQWVRVQWAITVGLAPAVLLLFGQVSIAGPLANAVAIPVVSVVVTPLALLAAAMPVDFILELAARLVEWLLQFLELCAALPGALWQQHAPSPWAVAAALAGAVWVLAPRGVPGRGCGLALMAPAFLVSPVAPSPGEAWITAFDVGQGLAVVVRTATRTLIYDAGPAFGPEAYSGGRIVVPELRAAGASGVDLMVLTHEDMDHIGGALSVLESLEVQELASSLPQAHALNALVPAPRRCLAGESWDWDAVRFAFLHPRPEDEAVRRNNQSCVMRIEAGGRSMLLTGDIERAAEQTLLFEQKIKADVMLVPHHGSRTSSSAEFVEAVAPRWAIVAAGYRNRFGHPNSEVLKRYESIGTSVFRTDRDGAIHVRLGSGEVRVEAERARRPRYWRGVPPV